MDLINRTARAHMRAPLLLAELAVGFCSMAESTQDISMVSNSTSLDAVGMRQFLLSGGYHKDADAFNIGTESENVVTFKDLRVLSMSKSVSQSQPFLHVHATVILTTVASKAALRGRK